MKTCPETAVVIVTYNGLKWVDQCLGSLDKSVCPLRTIVIDNASTDGTPAYIREKFPEARLIPNRKNLGFGPANNLGIKKAVEDGAEYVFLLNQDAWIDPDTIATLAGVQQKHPEFGILSPMHLNAARTALDSSFAHYLAPEFCPDIYSDIYLGGAKSVYETEFVNAAAWLISRDCIHKVGLFDPLFPHYGEDRNYCQRVQYHGYKAGICPAARIVHDRGERKGVRPGYDGRAERQRYMLTILSDVRNPDPKKQIWKYKMRFCLDIVKYSAVFGFAQARESLSDYLYLKKKEKAILESLSRNRVKSPEPGTKTGTNIKNRLDS